MPSYVSIMHLILSCYFLSKFLLFSWLIIRGIPSLIIAQTQVSTPGLLMATERAEPLLNGVQLSLVVETCCMWTWNTRINVFLLLISKMKVVTKTDVYLYDLSLRKAIDAARFFSLVVSFSSTCD